MGNILVVDDDLDIHALFKVEFKKSPHKLFFAKNAMEAVEALKSEYIGVVFLDIILGSNETSQSVVSKVKNVPVLLMSSYITDDYKENILQKNTSIVDCLKKPFKKGIMLEKATQYLASQGEDNTEQENSTTIKSTTQNMTDEATLVAGSGQDAEDSQLVKGHSEDEDNTVTKIEGVTDSIKEESTLVKGDGQNELKDELTIVSGESEEDDNFHQILQLENTQTCSPQELKYKNDIIYLTKKGPKSRTLDGYTRLMISVLLEKKIEVELALDEGEDLEDKCKGGYTSLHLAVLRENLEVVEFLIDKGAKVNARDNDGREPLFFAIQKNNVKMVELLIEKGAPINRRVKGRTYLILAAIKKNLEMFKIFESKGISKEIRDDNGFNVRHYLKKYKIENFLEK
ncbi:ankyrin repeat domain-containing protein [Halobacteriovorax sp. HLS]|uniref:ankyrin repeat domain-containing protein n=1 Tax=Halobacteriovorax sp. HLS TaxID=2234000 RepID=UPI000FD8B8A9|nr:ankyrin repeat domain-containing protein [Halobacteriovorax sp. HLS]